MIFDSIALNTGKDKWVTSQFKDQLSNCWRNMENMLDNSEEIKITWIKNPNRFAFHPVGDEKYYERIKQLEALLIKNCTKSPQFVPEVGQVNLIKT